jgi:hypothetical protein
VPPTPSAPVDPVKKVDIDGPIGGLTGSCPQLSFTVRGTAVIADSSTNYDAGNCSSMKNGRKVEISGTMLPDGRVHAEKIKLEKDDD